MKRLYLTSSSSFVIDRIVKDLKIKAPKNKLVFISTASEVEKGDLEWLENDRKSLIAAGFDLTKYTITNKNEKELRHDLKDFDFIFLAGGNTFYLLEKAQQSGFVKVVSELVLNDGKIYIGSSAGSVIAGPDIYSVFIVDDVSLAPNLEGYKGFGLVDFITFPHWGNEKFKDKYLNKRLNHSFMGKDQAILLRDNQYIEVRDDWYRIIEV